MSIVLIPHQGETLQNQSKCRVPVPNPSRYFYKTTLGTKAPKSLWERRVERIGKKCNYMIILKIKEKNSNVL